MNKIFFGCVESRIDPLKLGRCKVRVVGLHTPDKAELPTDDLPWAMPMQPATSAGISGLGYSPLGLVEGTWVLVTFTDKENQNPIILGSVGGIPNTPGTIESDEVNVDVAEPDDGVIRTSDGTKLTSSDGTPVTYGEYQQLSTPTLKRAVDFTPSNQAIELVKKWEGFKANAYQDSVGVWTIGYGSTRVNGQKVQPGQVITESAARAEMLSFFKTDIVAYFDVIRQPVTQSMVDALCCLIYNIGIGAFKKSTVLQSLNSGKYTDAAAAITLFNKAGGKVLRGLVSRRNDEKELFLKDGIPNIAGELTPPVKTEEPTPQQQTTNIAKSLSDVNIGFKDPKGKYPLYLKEPDTNRLARHENIKKTAVYSKEVAEHRDVETAGGKKWSQSPVPYNAQYPFNHVYASESGHLLEFDDTPNSERVHIYHKSGTFVETDANGTQVRRIVGDNYEILERNGFVHIVGDLNVTIDGVHRVKVNNAAMIDISGKTTVNIFNDCSMNVSGNMDLSVGETFALKAKKVSIESESDIDIKAASALRGQSSTTSLKSSGLTAMDGSVIRLNEGASQSASPKSVQAPGAKQDPEEKEFPALIVRTRGAETAAIYETPEEGDPSVFIEQRIDNGEARREEVQKEPEELEQTVPPTITQKETKNIDCNIIFGMENLPSSLSLSKNFTIGSMTKNGTRPLIGQQGLTKQEIACNLKNLCENVLEPVISRYPNMIITSAFRRPSDVPNSSKTSQHYTGEAVDIVLSGFDRKQHYEAIQEIQQLVPYDQLILEYSGSQTVWIHISLGINKRRKQAFTMNNHKTIGQSFVLIA